MKHGKNEKTKGVFSKILGIFVKLIIILAFIAGIYGTLKLAPNYMKNEITNKTNLVINFSNVTARIKQDMIIDENGVVYLSMDDIKNYYDDNIYYDKQYKQIVTSSETKLAVLPIGENQITVNGESVKIKGCAKFENDVYYLPISELEDVYDVKVRKAENKVIIESLDKKLTTAKANKNLSVKYKPTFFSRTLDKVNKGEKVYIAEVADNSLPQGWLKVRTEKGNIGYVEEKNLIDKSIERNDKVYEKQISGKVSLAWDYFSEYGKAPDNTGIKYDGVNAVSPSFFNMKLKDTQETNNLGMALQTRIYENVGESGVQYINWAKSNGYKVWPKVSNDTISTTIDEFSTIINDYKSRDILIKQILEYVKKYDLDGINLDFEYMYEKDNEAFSRFVIELAPQLRNIGKCLSVDVTAPYGGENWSLCYDRNLIGEVADYVVFMGYDQNGSNKFGTTASYNWLENNINSFLNIEDVPSEKLILGLPFYTRLWKTKNGEVVGSSDVITLKNVDSAIPENATKEWLEDQRQYYIEYEKNGYVYKMWVEDEKSFAEKISLVKKYDLAGAAYWRKGFDSDSIWKVIRSSLNLK